MWQHRGCSTQCSVNPGAASQAMLYFLQQMHNKDKDRLERGQVAYDLKAVHINEACIDLQSDSAVEQPSFAAPEPLVSTCKKANVLLHLVPLEAVFLETDQEIPCSGLAEMPQLRKNLQRLLQVTLVTLALPFLSTCCLLSSSRGQCYVAVVCICCCCKAHHWTHSKASYSDCQLPIL